MSKIEFPTPQRRLRFHFTLLLLFTTCAPVLSQTMWRGGDLSFVPTNNLQLSPWRGHAELMAKTPETQVGGVLTLELSFHNTGASATFYNPFFNLRVPPPAELAVFDSDKRYIGNLLRHPMLVARMSPTAQDWVYIPSKASVSTIIDIGSADLVPGRYYVQVVFTKHFTATNVADFMNRSPGASVPKHAAEELFRSNPVEITIAK